MSLSQATERALVWPAKTHGHCPRCLVDAVLQAAGHSPAKIVADINSVHTLKAVVEVGPGPTMMPLGLAQREVSEGRLVAHRLASPAMHRVLGLCVSVHLPTGNAKRAIFVLIGQVMRELAQGGKWGAFAQSKPQQCEVDRGRSTAPRFKCWFGKPKCDGSSLQDISR